MVVFPAPVLPDKGIFLTRRSVEIYVVKNGLLWNIAEIDIIKYHVAL